MSNHLAYVDASAFVKLFKPELETDALETALSEWPELVSSELLEVEALRTAGLVGGRAACETLLSTVTLLPLTASIRASATQLAPARLRTLDAIHVATAHDLGNDVGLLFSYDADMLTAASLIGVPIRAPSPGP